MKIKNFCKSFLIFTLLSNLNLSYASSNNFEQELKERGPILHYNSAEEYFLHRGSERKMLVVGCGHNAFEYNKEQQKMIAYHGPDKCSKNHLFSHADAFTITARDGMGGIFLHPDINGFFPAALPQTAQFNEIFFEEVDGGTEQLYTGSYKHLLSGGTLVDDRYGPDCNDLSLKKAFAIDYLINAGFTDIEFEDEITDPHNGRKKRNLIKATKLPDLTKENDVLYTHDCTNAIKNLKSIKNNYSYNILLNEILRGYYRNLHKIFKDLYLEYKRPLPIIYKRAYTYLGIGETFTDEIHISNFNDILSKKA